MKNFIAAVCLMIALPAFAAPRDYQATPQEDGTICAKVQVVTVGNTYATRTYCRTESEWQEAGYKVSRRPIQAAQQEGNEQLLP